MVNWVLMDIEMVEDPFENSAAQNRCREAVLGSAVVGSSEDLNLQVAASSCYQLP